MCVRGQRGQWLTSQLFPRQLGRQLASRLLYLAEPVSAAELVRAGFASTLDRESADGFDAAFIGKLRAHLDNLSPEALRTTKALVKSETERKRLRDLNHAEMARVAELSVTPWFQRFIRDRQVARAKR